MRTVTYQIKGSFVFRNCCTIYLYYVYQHVVTLIITATSLKIHESFVYGQQRLGGRPSVSEADEGFDQGLESEAKVTSATLVPMLVPTWVLEKSQCHHCPHLTHCNPDLLTPISSLVSIASWPTYLTTHWPIYPWRPRPAEWSKSL